MVKTRENESIDCASQENEAQMISLRLVVDTNIVVSAALKPYRLHCTVLLLAIAKPARLYVSDSVFTEYRIV
jgi:hypothetical protein